METTGFEHIKNKVDYIAVDEMSAISAEGEIFHVGDEVVHEGDDTETVRIIKKFSIDKESMDVLAHNEEGHGRICFLRKFK